MPDHDRLDDAHSALARPGRTADLPSSTPTSGELTDATTRRWTLPRPRRPEGGTVGLRPRLTQLSSRLARLRPQLVEFASGPARQRLIERLDLPDRRRTAIAAATLCTLGVVAFVDAQVRSSGPTDPARVTTMTEVAAPSQLTPQQPGDGDDAADAVSTDGAAPSADGTPARGEASAHETAPDAADNAQPPASTAPADTGPVAGLSEVQMNNAKAIVRTGHDMGMSRKGLIIGVATAMQESELLNRASEVLPESKRYPHQGTGWDHDSVGLFQQRTSTGWGPVGKLMDPAYSSQRFFAALGQVAGWERMRLTEAAQAVQVSAYPEHYAKHEARATKVVDAILPTLG